MNKILLITLILPFLSCSTNINQSIIEVQKKSFEEKYTNFIKDLKPEIEYKHRAKSASDFVQKLIEIQSKCIKSKNTYEYIELCNSTSSKNYHNKLPNSFISLIANPKNNSIEQCLYLQSSEIIDYVSKEYQKSKIQFKAIDILAVTIDSLTTKDSTAKALYIIGLPKTKTKFMIDSVETNITDQINWGYVKNDLKAPSNVIVSFSLTEDFSQKYSKRIIRK